MLESLQLASKEGGKRRKKTIGGGGEKRRQVEWDSFTEVAGEYRMSQGMIRSQKIRTYCQSQFVANFSNSGVAERSQIELVSMERRFEPKQLS